MLSLYQRIKEKRESLGMSQDELAHRLGYTSRSTVSKIESGKVDLSQSRIKAFADALNTTPAYLMGWEDEEERQDDNQIPPGCMPLPKTHKIPLLGDVACGIAKYADENFNGYIETSEDVRADFCLRADGDSMIGARILDGDIVFIRKQEMVDNGEIAVVVIDDSATLKRVYYDRKSNIIKLVAENPSVPTQIFSGEELNQVHILGKAVAFQSDVR